MRADLVVALLLVAAVARASSPLPEAMQRFDAGEYEEVVAKLRDSVDGSVIADPIDRAQALRLYGIACALTGRSLAAEAAFLHWLGLDGRARLDPNLVRPDVVAFFEEVRAHHREELVREVERRRPRTATLNLLPPAGQFQNGQRRKFAALLSLELGLSATSLGTFIALFTSQRADGTFPDVHRADLLRGVNWGATFALAAVVVYGIVDGFVYFRRLRDAARREEADLRAGRVIPTADGLALRF